MKSSLKRQGATFCLAFVTILGSFVGPASVARADDDVSPNDARLDAFQKKSVAIENSGTALSWLGFMGLGVIGLLGMFKDAKRSHLD
ncbi:MAG TPA: hypothetical protein VFW23_16895 [Tepidisphaeraceae bacterium]|nr:hypothetical protein [Tepidisphaeraceae bacterium]